MSPVIAFDIAVVAQKVKVQCCYVMADMLNLKRWGCCWVSSRSGWLLELLTELTNIKMIMILVAGSQPGCHGGGDSNDGVDQPASGFFVNIISIKMGKPLGPLGE